MAELSTLGAVIATAYEGQSDRNAFTDAEKVKLDNMTGAYADLTGTGSTNHIMQAIVPGTWEYRFVPGTSRTVSTWFEGDYA